MVSEFVEQCGRAFRLQERAVPRAIVRGREVASDAIRDRRLVVLTGCGDSYAVAEYGAWLLLQEGINAVAVSAPDTQRVHLDDRCTVVGVTASGRSLATIGALEHARRQGALTVALTDNERGEIIKVVDTCWVTDSGVVTYDIIPTAPTTAAMALLLGVMEQVNQERYEGDTELLREEMSRLFREAEGEGRQISELISPEQRAYFISEGPNFVAAQLGMMKMNEAALTQGIAIQREEFQHYGSLPTRRGDLAVLVTDSPASEGDMAFTRVLWESLGLKAFHLHVPETSGITTPHAQAIVNTVSLQSAVYYALRRFAPDMEWFRLPHAKAFKIY